VLIIFGRFIPGVRTLTSVSAGVLGYGYGRFLFASVIAGSIWATYAGLLGYFVGDAVGNVWVSIGISIAASFVISTVLLFLERPRLRGLLRK
jgi:membrane protein DedA with SNARE-associated domain